MISAQRHANNVPELSEADREYRLRSHIDEATAQYHHEVLGIGAGVAQFEAAQRALVELREALMGVQKYILHSDMPQTLYQLSLPLFEALNLFGPALDKATAELHKRLPKKKPGARRSEGGFEVLVRLLADIWLEFTGSKASVVRSSGISAIRTRGSPFTRFAREILDNIDPVHGRKGIEASIEKILYPKKS
jgi:hypothetical protein